MKEVIFIIALFCICIFASNKFAESSCYAAWNKSEMKVDYSMMGGCLIQLPNGKWIPTDALKYFGEDK